MPLPLFAISYLKGVLFKRLGGFMFKRLFINWVLPGIYDALIQALMDLSRKSDNTVDDEVMNVMHDNRDRILDEIKSNL